MLTKNSTIGQLLKNPIGRDIIDRLVQYVGLQEKWIDNPLVRGLKLGMLKRLSGGKVSDALLDVLLGLMNQDEGYAPIPNNDDHCWWKEAVVYQIYPRSFKDSDGDGVGDLGGIMEKLDYLSALGVTAVWLSPVFDSPNDDNGYDVRDYKRIMTEFGSMVDMDALVEGLHARGIKLILDLVFNHTSDEHEWFIKSKGDAEGPYGDYYIWRKGDGAPPNNWKSIFSGSAWNYYPERGEYALHLFSKKQMDLNWENASVREDIYDIIRFWLKKGADGFRLDVINYISKTSLADGDETIGSLLGFSGVEHYFYGSRLHEFLHEARVKAFNNAFLIGETPGLGPEMCTLLTAPSRAELDTVFFFDHLDELGKSRFDAYRYNLNHLKNCFIGYQGRFADRSWPSIFIENHDNPRMPSKVDPTGEYREEIAKLLAVLVLTARGVPFIYQGQELGAVNTDFHAMDELRDVESLNYYREHTEAGTKAEDVWARVKKGTRDHARTPMQWTAAPGGGFSTADPWIRLADPGVWNAASQSGNSDSMLESYRFLIALRKQNAALVYGGFVLLFASKRNLFCYERRLDKERFVIVANLRDKPIRHPRLGLPLERIYGSYPDAAVALRPYEACIYRVMAT